MVVIAAVMLSFLLPFSFMRNIFATLAIAVTLIILLLLLSVSWHSEGGTPFDIILITGIALSFLYLVSFYAFDGGFLNSAVVLLFAAYYALMAALLYQHRALPAGRSPVDSSRHAARPAVRQRYSARYSGAQHYDPTHDPAFRRGIEPIAEQVPPPVHRHGIFHRFFRRGVQPIPEREPPHHAPRNREEFAEHAREHMRRQGIEPIHEMKPPKPAKAHSDNFKRGVEPLNEAAPPAPGKKHPSSFAEGMEPIHGLTDQDIHRLETYDFEPKRANKRGAARKTSRKRK